MLIIVLRFCVGGCRFTVVWEQQNEYRRHSGRPVGHCTLDQCKEACVNDGLCIAIDFDSDLQPENRCKIHVTPSQSNFTSVFEVTDSHQHYEVISRKCERIGTYSLLCGCSTPVFWWKALNSLNVLMCR